LVLRCWEAERSFARLARFRRLTGDYERLPETSTSFHRIVFAILMVNRFIHVAIQ
jgi:transposase